MVITASPGAGKTTRLPPALLSLFTGKLLVLEPRKMAAIAAAHRVAEENSWRIGEEVGYQVRFVNKTTSHTRLIYMTEALLARQMIQDPELTNVDMVILDEFHERSLYVDLTLGLLRELQALGHPLKIIIMSATLDAEKIAEYLGNCPIVTVPGKLFELEIRHQASPQLLKTQYAFYDHVMEVIQGAQLETKKDILVFLPGVGEIERLKEKLFSWAENKQIELVSLHGSLPLEAQRKALQKSSIQRIILATNIAESSVTLDGVNTVIDSGLVKMLKQDLRTGFSRLELVRISLSSAIQRSGRAARQFPGICYRMWTKSEESAFAKADIPEILRSDLSDSLLYLAAQGIRNFENFMWFEKPASVIFDRAIFHLQAMGALNENNELSQLGRQILHFPLSVRLGRLLIAGIEHGHIELAAKMAALLQEKDILKKEAVSHRQADESECDLSLRLTLLNDYLNHQSVKEAHYNSLQLVVQSYTQIVALAHQMEVKICQKKIEEHEAKQLLLISAFSDRLCRRRKESDRGLMVNGRGIKLSDQTLVKHSEFFIALSGIEGSSEADTLVSHASRVNKDFILEHLSDQIILKKDIIFDANKNQFYQRELKTLWDLPLEDASLSFATPLQVAENLPAILTDNWDNTLSQNEHLYEWWQKILFLRFHQAFLPEKIQAELADLFTHNAINRDFCLASFSQAAMGESRVANILQKNLAYFFELNVSHDLRTILQNELPAKLKMPSGSLIPIHYSAVKAPFLEVRIQEIFGLTKTPRILFQHIPIVFHLLGPNFRPVQITSDLESFWHNGYADIRKELRIRYPRHQWPLNPADGIPLAKGHRRKK